MRERNVFHRRHTMNRNRTFLAALTGLLLLGGCVASPPPAATPGHARLEGCQSQATSRACPAAAVVNVNLNKAGGSAANPECVKAGRGSQVTINIAPVPGKTGGAITLPENAANGWLVASNVDAAMKHKIVIDVPEDAALGEHKYYVLSDTGVCLDPRFVVE
jgi:hypothetical protein